MLYEKRNAKVANYFANHAEIKTAFRTGHTREKVLALKMIQRKFQRIVAIQEQSEGVNKALNTIPLMKMLNFVLSHLKNFLNYSAPGRTDARSIGSIRLDTTSRGTCVGLPFTSKRPIVCLGTIG